MLRPELGIPPAWFEALGEGDDESLYQEIITEPAPQVRGVRMATQVLGYILPVARIENDVAPETTLNDSNPMCTPEYLVNAFSSPFHLCDRDLDLLERELME